MKNYQQYFALSDQLSLIDLDENLVYIEGKLWLFRMPVNSIILIELHVDQIK